MSLQLRLEVGGGVYTWKSCQHSNDALFFVMRPTLAAKWQRCKTTVAKVVIISVAHFWSSGNEIGYVMLFQHLLQHLCHTVLLQRSGTSHGVTGALSVLRVNAVYLKFKRQRHQCHRFLAITIPTPNDQVRSFELTSQPPQGRCETPDLAML